MTLAYPCELVGFDANPEQRPKRPPKRTPPIPTFITFDSATPVQGFNYNSPSSRPDCTGAPYGAVATETFQILDASGDPIKIEGLAVEERVFNSVITIGGYIVPIPDSKWVSPTIGNGPTLTDSSGKFTDSPFGWCFTDPAVNTFSQQYRVNVAGWSCPKK
jgi:hypothetical protein